MLIEQKEFLVRFVAKVKLYHETHNKAKEYTRSGNHSGARGLHNDAQKLGDGVTAMIPQASDIISDNEQLALL